MRVHPMREANSTREALLEQGVAAEQGDAMAVRVHEEEVLMEHFKTCIFVFLLFVYMLMPTMMGLLIWVVVSTYRDQEECDMPLQKWAFGVVFIAAYNMTLNRQTPEGSTILRVFLRWTRDPNDPDVVPPRRVDVYNACLSVFIFSWNIMGLYWARTSGLDKDAVLPDCRNVAPHLHSAVQVYAASSLAFTLFTTFFMMGFKRLLRGVMYRGLLNSSNAAPAGSLEKNTSEVSQQDGLLCQHPICPICLEDFSDLKLARKTNGCKHLYHKGCLECWLKVNRTCPVCRADLAA